MFSYLYDYLGIVECTSSGVALSQVHILEN
ncbi:hypothetical protein QOZ91_000184 [Clostridium sardiniense]|nr:hypothetical protein [Clostridium sardiniense]